MTHKLWLKLLTDSKPELQRAIVRWGPESSLISICELVLNILHDRVPGIKGIRKSNKTHRYYLEKLADRTVSLERKRKFLLKKQGRSFLRTLLKNNFCSNVVEEESLKTSSVPDSKRSSVHHYESSKENAIG